jgi:hypothetical protein
MFTYMIHVVLFASFEVLQIRYLVETGADFVYMQDTWK